MHEQEEPLGSCLGSSCLHGEEGGSYLYSSAVNEDSCLESAAVCEDEEGFCLDSFDNGGEAEDFCLGFSALHEADFCSDSCDLSAVKLKMSHSGTVVVVENESDPVAAAVENVMAKEIFAWNG